MSFALREDMPSFHSVIRRSDYEPSSRCTTPIGVTCIRQGPGRTVLYDHFLQPAGHHDYLLVQADSYYSQLLAANKEVDGVVPSDISSTFFHPDDTFIAGHVRSSDGEPEVYCSYRETYPNYTESPFSPNESRYIVELGARSLWAALKHTPQRDIFNGDVVPLIIQPEDLRQATVKLFGYR